MLTLLINSAHGKYPVGSEGWIQATGMAVRELAAQGHEFICSTDPLPWDLITYLAGVCGARIRLIIKTAGDKQGFVECARLIEEFALNGNHVLPMFLDENVAHLPAHPKDSWQIRDRFAFTAADAIYPVSIRPEGRLERLIGEPGFQPKIRNDYRIPWTPMRRTGPLCEIVQEKLMNHFIQIAHERGNPRIFFP